MSLSPRDELLHQCKGNVNNYFVLSFCVDNKSSGQKRN